MQNNHDEIDLIEVAIKIFAFLKRRFIILLSLSLIGGIIGFSIAKLSPSYYQFSFIGKSVIASNEIIIKQIELLNDKITNKTTAVFQEKPIELCAAYDNIVKIEVNSGEETQKKEEKESEIEIIVETSKPVNETLLTNTIIKEFATNQYFINELETQKTQLQELISNLESQIENYDNNWNLKGTDKKSPIYVVNSKPESLTQLVNSKLKAQKSLQHLKAFTVIQRPNHSLIVKKSSISYGAIASSILLFGGLIFFLFKEMNTYSKKILLNNKEPKLKKTA